MMFWVGFCVGIAVTCFMLMVYGLCAINKDEYHQGGKQ